MSTSISIAYIREFNLGNADRYNPSNVGILEDYLYHQARSEEYDCLANLAILKLYVSFPLYKLIIERNL